VYSTRVSCAELGTCALPVLWIDCKAVHIMYSYPRAAHSISTAFAQVLRIQFALNVRYGGADVGIDLCFAFNLFDRVDGGRVVFAAEFAGDLRKAEV
jgi:hypothetical protein